MILHTFDEALSIARKLRSTPDPELQRAATGLSLKAILSLAVLAHQLDELAQSAAAYVTGTPTPEHYAALQERLLAAGYLPLPKFPAPQEADRGQS